MNEDAHRSKETTEENKDVYVVIPIAYHKTTFLQLTYFCYDCQTRDKEKEKKIVLIFR